jgi:ubiquinone/menaquinone biosynthesis C-methylase UbiE
MAGIRSDQPSDSLREVYERRAELKYAEPRQLPDPRVDRKFERMLDAGCGDGRYLVALAARPDRPQRVAGVDISERILDVARAATERAGLTAELRRANLEALPFADGSFDLVLCTQVIEHLLDPALGLRELARVLAPGGMLVVSTDHDRALVTRVLNAPRAGIVKVLGWTHRNFPVEFPHASFPLEGFAQLVEEAGLSVEHRETFRFVLMPPLGPPLALRALNRLDKALAPHRLGDIVAVVARKPPG